MVLISLETLLMPFSIGKIPHTPQTYLFHSFFLLKIFSECPLMLIQYSICDVRLPFACLSVCAIVENLLSSGLERSGQRGYRSFWPVSTQFFFVALIFLGIKNYNLQTLLCIMGSQQR